MNLSIINTPLFHGGETSRHFAAKLAAKFHRIADSHEVGDASIGLTHYKVMEFRGYAPNWWVSLHIYPNGSVQVFGCI